MKLIEMSMDNNQLSALDESPLFHLSMASLELFHSNFLYWLNTLDKNVFKKLISKLIGKEEENLKWPEEWKLCREKYNYDICIINPKDTKGKDTKDVHQDVWLVLENKVKSLPRIDQLNQYEKETPNAGGRRILLSLVEEFPMKEKINNDNKWKVISYNDLITAITELYRPEDNSYHTNLINDYCNYVRNLSSYVNEHSVFKSIGEINAVIKECEDYGISAVVKKLAYGVILRNCVKAWSENKIKWENDRTEILNDEKGEFVYANYGLNDSTGFF